MPTLLEELIDKASKHGWASGKGSLYQVCRDASDIGLTEVPVRRGDPAVTTLRPLDPDRARASSLSARYGKGDQPLHTDGAHIVEPPDLVVLISEATNGTPTRLWSLTPRSSLYVGPPDHVRHGVFLVTGGEHSFLSTAYGRRRLRYDPGCMVPCDARARETVRYFAKEIRRAKEFTWDEPGKLLVIDNRMSLHARASAGGDPGREIQRVCFRLKRESP